MAAGEIWIDVGEFKFRDGGNTIRTLNRFSSGGTPGLNLTGSSSVPSSPSAGQVVLGFFGYRETAFSVDGQLLLAYRNAANNQWFYAETVNDHDHVPDQKPEGPIRISSVTNRLQVLLNGAWWAIDSS